MTAKNIPAREPSLEGRTALVCGASRGIGRATAEALAKQGARVVLLARSENALMEVAGALPKPRKGGHVVLPCDVSKLDALEKSVKQCLANMGPAHILVNNSGGPKSGLLAEATDEAFLDALTQHVLASQRLAHVLVPHMKEAQFGRIVNIISTSVRVPIAGLGVSNTIRAAMAAWAKTLAGELAPFGITVNNVLPGYTTTERFEELVSAAAQRAGKTNAEIEAQWSANVPMARFASPAEVAAAICFFASPGASYITGQSLAVDGGRIGAI